MVKIIHCADLHLDSALSTNLDPQKRKERKLELLDSFVHMVDYADKEGISAILIAGDLFDSKNVSKTALNTFLRQVETHPQITFYYLKGNHDYRSLKGDEILPVNLKLFTDHFVSYILDSTEKGNIVVSGVEFNGRNEDVIYDQLSLNARDFNIVMMHGQTTQYNMGDKTEYIRLNRLMNRGIDYLALGHVHMPVREELDARGIYCFSGCLEGRGFDECGERGFMELCVDENSSEWTCNFVPFARRNLYTVEVNVTGCMQSEDMRQRAWDTVMDGNYDPDSLLKIVLYGNIDVSAEKNLDFILHPFIERFYFAKLYDETKLTVDFRQFAFDESLKGEFIRNVLSSELSEEEKGEIIHYGLRALAGEDILE